MHYSHRAFLDTVLVILPVLLMMVIMMMSLYHSIKHRLKLMRAEVILFISHKKIMCRDTQTNRFRALELKGGFSTEDIPLVYHRIMGGTLKLFRMPG